MLSELLKDLFAQVMSSAPRLDLSRREVLIENFIILHQVIRASEGLLQEAISATEALPPKQRSAFVVELFEYFQKHHDEEIGHDKWLADDLATVNVDVNAGRPIHEVVELVGSQYYLIRHAHPAALLPFLALLEWRAFPLDTVGRLERLHGAPLLRTLRHHAVHDVDHGKDLCSMLDRLPADLCELVIANGLRSAQLVCAAFRRCAARHG